ncbi:MAG: hypothetical protein HGA65_16675 [Oscillochloris sp.]|nr:hypothetical protein [Oscillochloris sp.]
MLRLLRLPRRSAMRAPAHTLSLLVCVLSVAIVAGVPLAGAPPPLPSLFGEPGVIKTFDPRLQQLERDIAAGDARSFRITFTQADLDAEVDAQFRRLAGKLPVSEAFVQPGTDLISAGGILTLGPASLPARVTLHVTAIECRPVVEIRMLSVGDGTTPGWLQARADALVHSGLDEALRRGLGFCLEEVNATPGAITITGRVEEQRP